MVTVPFVSTLPQEFGGLRASEVCLPTLLLVSWSLRSAARDDRDDVPAGSFNFPDQASFGWSNLTWLASGSRHKPMDRLNFGLGFCSSHCSRAVYVV